MYDVEAVVGDHVLIFRRFLLVMILGFAESVFNSLQGTYAALGTDIPFGGLS
jgi:hypothetical protein